MNEESSNINAILEAACSNGPLSYRDYIDTVLYHPQGGYYAKQRQRVGRASNADFYTAESLGPVFAELVVAAAAELLNADCSEATFVEIAAEPDSSLLQSLPNHPFKAAKTIRLGDPIEVSGNAIIFANEWLDALPFHRLIFKAGQWRERAVSAESGNLHEVLLPELSPAVAAQSKRLPDNAHEGYQLDWPIEAENALQLLLKQDWQGLLILFDYGKPWQELLQHCPSGTARTYHKHKSGNDLLQNPGEADITCDVIWSALQDLCKDADLQNLTLESQEAFFVQRAQSAAEAIVRESAGQFSTRRQTLMELIHPAHMGRKFQVLSALRK